MLRHNVVCLHVPAAAARRLRAGVGGLLRDDGQRGLPFNEDPQDSNGAAAAGKLANMTNSAKAVPGSRLRWVGVTHGMMCVGQCEPSYAGVCSSGLLNVVLLSLPNEGVTGSLA
jgi:hypothetical protein